MATEHKSLADGPPRVGTMLAVHVSLFLLKAFPALHGFMFAMHFFDSWGIAKAVLGLHTELSWIICLIGLWQGKHWAWWVAAFLDISAMIPFAGTTPNMSLHRLQPSQPRLILGSVEVLGFCGFLLLLTGTIRRHYNINRFFVAQFALAGPTQESNLSGVQKAVAALHNLVLGLTHLIAEPPSEIIVADKFVIRFAAVIQGTGSLLIQLAFLLFPIPLLWLYTVSGITFGVMLISLNPPARFLSSVWWGFTAYLSFASIQGFHPWQFIQLFCCAGMTVYLFFSAIFQLSHRAITQK